jgi:hypothetical protein
VTIKTFVLSMYSSCITSSISVLPVVDSPTLGMMKRNLSTDCWYNSRPRPARMNLLRSHSSPSHRQLRTARSS